MTDKNGIDENSFLDDLIEDGSPFDDHIEENPPVDSPIKKDSSFHDPIKKKPFFQKKYIEKGGAQAALFRDLSFSGRFGRALGADLFIQVAST
ncbi:MAG: hypothetical protein H8E17_09120 [Deltaproteobacteria bacterium]|nr:hypothetical protein [Deltaproteobacteria bacterium]